MKIGVRKVGEILIFFGDDGLGGTVHPDIGIDGYKRILGIIEKRRKEASRAFFPPKMDPDAADFANLIPDGLALVEKTTAAGSTFKAFNETGKALSNKWLPDLESAQAELEAEAPSAPAY